MHLRFGRISVSTIVGAVAGVLIAGAAVMARHAAEHQETDLHDRLHAAVPLDSNETAVLATKERLFLERRAEIELRLRVANGELASAIARNPSWSPEVEAATQQVERAAGDLQRATLVHVFEMRAGLKPDHRPAYDKVLIDALRRGSQ